MKTNNAKFVEGSTVKHILMMSGASTIGMMCMFFVDLMDMLFISLLGQVTLTAAIGIAGTLVYLLTSLSIGSSVSLSALVSRELGANKLGSAINIAISAIVITFLVSMILTVLIAFYLPEILILIGAKNDVITQSTNYLMFLLPSNPLLALTIAASAGLRSIGDAKSTLLATLLGGVVNVILDPIFIFVFDWGIQGAAVASVLATITSFLYTFYEVDSPTEEEVNIVKAQNQLEWRRCNNSPLTTNKYGILEPTGDLVSTQAIDVFLIPLVGFDAEGNRIGMGAGYYDRALTETRDNCVKIGCAHGVQQCDNITADPWDIALDAIATEAGITWTKS